MDNCISFIISLDLRYRLFNVEIHENGALCGLEDKPHTSHFTIIE